jgi:hypothetical protein
MVTAGVYISTTKYNICQSTAVIKVNAADLIDLSILKNVKSLILEISIIGHNARRETNLTLTVRLNMLIKFTVSL